jgi:hypothetical protein
MEKFKQGFFEYISAASNEKVHSQTLAWIFSKNCTAFTPEVKGEILFELFGKDEETPQNFIPLKSIAEIEDIDLFIECENIILIIENKIKSSQHSYQLYKYEYFTTVDDELRKAIFEKWMKEAFPNLNYEKNDVDEDFNKKEKKLNEKYSIKKYPSFEKLLKIKKPRYIYLNLINEPVDEKWINKSYEILFQILQKYFENKINEKSDPNDLNLLNDYIGCIKRLQDSVSYFKDLRNTKIREHVFKTGKTSKIILLDKQLNFENSITENSNLEIEEYIQKNQLETILQKQFYFDILKNLATLDNTKIKAKVSESHGNALLDFHFSEVDFNNDGNLCTGILQFQGSVIKLAIAVEKETPKINWKSIMIPAFERTLTDFVKNPKNQLFCKVANPIKVSNANLKDDKGYGFCSTKLIYNITDTFWQLSDNPNLVVLNCRQFAYDFFSQFKTKLN